MAARLDVLHGFHPFPHRGPVVTTGGHAYRRPDGVAAAPPVMLES